MTHFFLFAGELSADRHGALLIQALRKLCPDAHFSGVGGPELRASGQQILMPMEAFGVMGFSDVLKALPRLWSQYRTLRNQILKLQPEALIFIDSPGLSLSLAKSLRKRGYRGKIIQYISPTVWAYGKERIEKMAQSFDLLLTIYPFEPRYFEQSSLRAIYVGNPLKERIAQYRYDPQWTKLFGMKSAEHLVGIFPGSRQGEIARNLPKLLAAAEMMRQRNPEIAFGISCAHEKGMALMQKLLQESPLRHHQDLFFIPHNYSYELMKSSRSAIAKSGTVTLELALHGCPTVVMYELTRLNRWMATYFLKLNLPHYCIVNILREGVVFPELIAGGCTPERLFRAITALHEDGTGRTKCLEGCRQVQGLFPEANASKKAAEEIAALLGVFGAGSA